MPDERSEFMDAVHEPLLNTIIWNAPDHEHTRIQTRAWFEEALEEAFKLYELGGGDLVNVADHLLTPEQIATAEARQAAIDA